MSPPGELYQRYCKKAEIIHQFAENLAQTLGVFHGINETGKKLSLEGEPVAALSTVLFDQLQLMVIRVCALCDQGSRDDDASLAELVKGLSAPDFQKFLIQKEEQWASSVGHHRAGIVFEIPTYSKRDFPRTLTPAVLMDCPSIGRTGPFRRWRFCGS